MEGDPPPDIRRLRRQVITARTLAVLALALLLLEGWFLVKASVQARAAMEAHNRFIETRWNPFIAQQNKRQASSGAADVLAAVGVPKPLAQLGGAIATELFGPSEPSPPRAGLGIESKALQGGAFVEKVFPGSPAERIGLKAGDLIESMNGRSLIGCAREFGEWIAAAVPGAHVRFRVFRGGETIELAGELGTAAPRPRRGRRLRPL